MYRSLVESARYSLQRNALKDYPRFFDVEAAIQYAISRHAEYYPTISPTTVLRVLTTDSFIDDEHGFMTVPGFRVAFAIRSSTEVELLAIGEIPD